jgi:uncharacterized membrane protein
MPRAEGDSATRPWSAPGWPALAGLLAGAGVLHGIAPEPFESIVPRWLGDPTPWVLGSGVAEVACAVGLAVPRTRRLAATATAVLLVVVLPANVQMTVTALRSDSASTAYQIGTLARLPLQLPLIAWAVSVRRRTVSAEVAEAEEAVPPC